MNFAFGTNFSFQFLHGIHQYYKQLEGIHSKPVLCHVYQVKMSQNESKVTIMYVNIVANQSLQS